jgi:Rps23 Pro-64 3,4-dihydroxylase Tpa1-like proline 4-hydroxylase
MAEQRPPSLVSTAARDGSLHQHGTTMKETLRTDQFAVFDDFLSDEEFSAIWRYVQDEEYRHIHQGAIQAVFRIGDGNPLIGRTVFASSQRAVRDELLASMGGEAGRKHLFPTKSSMDFVIRRLLRLGAKIAGLIGRESADWSHLTAAAWVYQRGTALSWHRDGSKSTGAYTYYAHHEWNVTWGGELLVADETLKQKYYAELRRNSTVHQFDNQAENDYLLKIGAGRYIMAKPNRLVIIAGGNAHAIAQVNASAGNRVRASVSGFFMRPRGTRAT